ncbi:nickel-dependent hydrogenase large subunit [Thiolapillus sp.]|uniref:nickel-dependent hydrogenase large subunit n=3 Tax=Thiolapillus sp. TaxID=2017437 RepID=UPI0025CD6F1D|nr:nickel-dependent hydrogenase large subunit [Thiolapillus sp.]
MNATEGQISISLFPGDKRERVAIHSSRPLHAARVLVGKTPQQAIEIIPLLFNICGTAQSRAALLAMKKEGDGEGMPAGSNDHRIEAARDMLVLVENAREHLMRLFTDWPRLFSLPADNNNLPYLSQLQSTFRRALFDSSRAFTFDSALNSKAGEANNLIDKLDDYLRDHVFACETVQWLQIQDIAALHEWATITNTIAAQTIAIICERGWASQGQSNCLPLPELDSEELCKQLDQPRSSDFIATPQWQGECCETTSLSRQLDNLLIQSLQDEFQYTLITRWTARLVELARIPGQLRALHAMLQTASPVGAHSPVHSLDTDRRVASIEAARGRLIHRVQIENGRIRHYQILAPTEWNFHPGGLAAQTLGSIASRRHDDIDTLAHIMINVIDPCVGYDLRVH